MVLQNLSECVLFSAYGSITKTPVPARKLTCALARPSWSGIGFQGHLTELGLEGASLPSNQAELVCAADPPVLRAQIEQVGESRILWRTQEFATLLNVIEDSRDAEHITTSFELIQSDILGKFNGLWTLTPLHEDGEVVGCRAVLDQDLLPKGAQVLPAQCLQAMRGAWGPACALGHGRLSAKSANPPSISLVCPAGLSPCVQGCKPVVCSTPTLHTCCAHIVQHFRNVLDTDMLTAADACAACACRHSVLPEARAGAGRRAAQHFSQSRQAPCRGRV